MTIPVRQSTAFECSIGPVLDADGVAVTDCVVGDFKIKKTTGNFAALNASATLTHVSAGTYDLVLTTSDLDTVGLASVAIDDTVNACAPLYLQVMEEAIYDALFAASANAFTGAAGSTKVTGVVTTDTATAVTTVNGLAAGVITAAATHSDFITEVQSGLATAAALDAVDNFLDTEIGAIITALGTPSDLGSGATISANLADIEAQTDDIGVAGAGLTAADDAILAILQHGTYGNSAINTNVLQLGFTIGSPVDTDLVTDIANVQADVTAILADTNELQGDWANGGRLDNILDARSSQTSVDAIDDILDTEFAALVSTVGSLYTTALTQSYRAAGAAPTMAQFAFETLAHLGDCSISGTTKTLNNLAGSAAKTFTLNSSTTPTSITETT